jgi:hypothetical protein
VEEAVAVVPETATEFDAVVPDAVGLVVND